MVAAVVRDVIERQRFTDFGTLRDAVEARCRDLRLSCTRAQVERALDLVSSNTALVHPTAPVQTVNRPTGSIGFSKTQAAAFMAELPGLLKRWPTTTGGRR